MRILILFLFLFLSIAVHAQFQLNGVATNLGGGTYQLTPAANSQFGAIWYKLQHNLNNPFNVQGQLNFGADPGGADGIAFVMQNSCLAAGGSGGGLGYSGIPGQSIAVEFDTYQNIAGTGVELNNDPAYDHIAVERNGNVVHDGGTNTITAPVQMDPVLTNVKTGNWYDFKISYSPATKLLQVYFNGSLRVSVTYDLLLNEFTTSPWVYWGFTSSTGGHNNIQQININSTYSTHLLEDTTICTGSIPITLDPLTSLRGTNIALNNPTFASSNQATVYQIADGNLGTRWESVWAVDPQWVYVDLQSPTDIDSVTIDWEAAYATAYEIQTSTDATTWTTAFSTTTGDGAHDKIVFSATNVRYVRMYGTARSLSSYGYSIWEFGVYGQPKYLWSPNDGSISPDIYSASVVLTPTATTTYSVMIPDPCLGFTTYNMTVTISCPAPVELVGFEVQASGNNNVLEWTTASETNTKSYEIFRSTNGITFDLIGSMGASGNSTKLKSYQFQDQNSPAGTTYYKIVSVDFDGAKQESPIKSIFRENTKAFLTNPVFENETALIIPQGVSSFEYTIVDMVGKEIGKASMANPASAVIIGQSLAPGGYTLILSIDHSSQSSLRMTKIK